MFRRGSTLWFIAHDLRVTWRTWFQRRPRRAQKRRRFVPLPLVIVGVLLIGSLAAGIPVANALRDQDLIATPLVAFIVDAALLLIFTLMLSQTLVAAVDAFYDRGDLDLLLSSPIPPTRILVMRAVAMALNPALLFSGLVTPFVVPIAVLGHPQILAVYIVVASLAFLSTAVGLAIAIGLFSTIGPRRTRTIAQVLAALVGAAFVIVAQIPNLMGVNKDTTLEATWLGNLVTGGDFPNFALWPAQAFLGAPVPLLAFLAVALGGFAIIAGWVGRRFARDAAAAAGADTVRRRKGRQDARFGAGLRRAIMGKEWRLMIRDPGLISQVLLRMIYLIPLAIVILTDRNGSAGDTVSLVGPIVAAGSALLAGQLSGSVAWIVISAEDAPQLLASAPVPIRGFWRAKLSVALIIPAVLLTPLLLLFAVFEPLAALVALPTAAAAAWSAAMINLWLQKPTKRSEFRRAWSATFGANMLELISSMSLAAFAGMLVGGVVTYSLIPLAVAALVVLLARRSEEAITERITEAI